MGPSHRASSRSRKLRPSKPSPSPATIPDAVVPDPDPTATALYSECGYCTEDQLEDLLLKNLDYAYLEALNRLGSLGYSEDVAMHAVLCAGHCCGPADVITNIVENCVDWLSNPAGAAGGAGEKSKGGAGGGFSDLRRLEEYSLAGMVCLVQQTRRGISRGDAMWCLLMGELNVSRACQIDLPPPNCCSPPPVTSPPCLMPGGGGSCSSSGGSCFSCSGEVGMMKGGGGKMVNGSEEFVDELLKELEELQIEEKKKENEEETDAQAERIYDLIRQAREMEAQVKERKEWAQQKALQAARKLSHDTMELRNLRTEREKRERAKKAGNEKQTPAVMPDEATVKRLEGMEEALKKASLQVDRANGEVHRLEAENAEIRAEMEAAKLSADESIRARQEAAKREKKVRKKSQNRDRQKQQIQDEIDEVKRKQVEIQREVEETERASKRLESRLRAETKSKDETLILLSDLTKSTESTKSNAQIRINSLRQKTNLDSQRCKDDILRLQEELSRLQSSQFIKKNTINNNTINNNNNNNVRNMRGERRWKCVVCVKDEVSVLLLPCAHQVLCVGCSECQVSMGKMRCPSCDKKVEERIRVFGVST